VPGELLVGGAGVARGYLGRDELTAERFVRHPAASGRRVYRTGDLVRWRSGARLEFLGRLDQQVKLRGFRIELGEIEAALREAADVADAVVVLREDRVGDPRLTGYVVPAERPPDSTDLRSALGARLPAYMVPSAIVLLPELPRTPNGKLDRAALPPPELATGQQARYVAPRTPVEIELAAGWAQVLGVPRVGRTDDFFELGGHSLLMVQLVARVRAAFGVDLPLRAAFDHPTLAEMADVVSSQLLADADAADLELLVAEMEGLRQQ
jgi:acyl carrier protein